MLPCGTASRSYAQDIAIVRTRFQWGLTIGAIILAFCVPLFVSNVYVISLMNYILITVVCVLGLQIVMGYCGLVSLGQAAFMAVGAFTSAILTTKFGWPFLAALPMAAIITGLVGLIGGAPSLRIKGFYLAMATLATHFIIMWVIMHLKITGGTTGIIAPPPYIGGVVFNTDHSMYYIILSVTVIMTFCAKSLARSKIGRAFIAIRDNDLAAEVMGVNLFSYKMLSFFISCFYAGVAGSLWAHWMISVHPEQFTLFHAIWYVGMIIVGGMGSITGVFFGVIFLRLLDEGVMVFLPSLAEVVPALGEVSGMTMLIFGLTILIFLIFEPRGLYHRWDVYKSSYRLYPFAD